MRREPDPFPNLRPVGPMVNRLPQLDACRCACSCSGCPPRHQRGVPARTGLVTSWPVDHLALPVTDQVRSRRFYETYFGFGARPPRRYDDDVLMLYNAAGFARALRLSTEPIARLSWMHFGIGLPDRDAVLALRDQLICDGVELVEEWDEPGYVSVKCRDPDGYIVEASWEPQ
jgi:catechol 2,3-dioxygenase-like lactoylglutathione lyase family enzyme